MFRKTFLEIDLDNLLENTKYLIEKTNKKVMAIVKADGYGLVDYYIASFLENEGIDFFGVSNLDEAIRLRKHGIKSKILVMGLIEEFDLLREYDISVITPSFNYVKEHQDKLKDIRVHIKVNTGLNRLGILKEETKDALDLLIEAKAKIEGIMTHYACNADREYTKKQYKDFKEIVNSLNYKFGYIHTAASDAIVYLEDDISNYTRLGLALFGYTNIENNFAIKPILSLYSEVVDCKKVNKGEGVSYGHKYISDGEGYISTVAIGYADGVNRNLSGKKVHIGDIEGTIVGTICMDLLMIKTDVPLNIHDKVELIGKHHSVYDRAKEVDSCCCQVITSISDRVTRLYIKDHKVVDEINQKLH